MTESQYQGETLVFIVGCPRSGTTWLQKILACHPRIKTGQESDLFDAYIGPQLRAWRRDKDPKSSGRGAIGMGCYLKESEFLALLREYLLKLLTPMLGGLGPGQLFLEKTPSHALFIPEIVELLPESRFIHVLRDARDVAASLLAASTSWGSHWAPRTPAEAAVMWVQHVKAARGASLKLTPGQFLEVRYEDLQVSTADVVRETCRFLKLEWSSEEMEKSISANQAEKAKAGGGTPIPLAGEAATQSGPVLKEPEGFVRKARQGAWREDLSLRARFKVWKVAKDTMKEFGYPWPFPW